MFLINRRQLAKGVTARLATGRTFKFFRRHGGRCRCRAGGDPNLGMGGVISRRVEGSWENPKPKSSLHETGSSSNRCAWQINGGYGASHARCTGRDHSARMRAVVSHRATRTNVWVRPATAVLRTKRQEENHTRECGSQGGLGRLSRAPVPFYVTTFGYGLLIDTLRHAEFYCGEAHPKPTRAVNANSVTVNTPQQTRDRDEGVASRVLVEVPRAAGVDVYLFGGPSMLEAVQRYNLLSGGI